MDARAERQQALRERLDERAHRDAVPEAARQLSELLGTTVAVDRALPRAAVDAARAAHLEQLRFHLIWRRVWGVRLRDEMIETARRIGTSAPDAATLVWCWWDPARKPVQAIAVAFEVETATVLAQLPRHLGPPPGGVGPGGVGSDPLLVTPDGSAGLHLDYEHHPDRDEYEMLVWGAFAHPVLP